MKYGVYDVGESPSSLEEYVEGAHIFVLRTPSDYVSTTVSLEDDGWEVRDSIKIIFEENSIQAGLFRKPFKGTVASNVIKNGCGGINIDDCRIPTNGETPKGSGNAQKNTLAHGDRNALQGGSITPPEGRFPANLLISHNHPETENCSPSCPTQLFPDGSVNIPTEYKNKTTAGQEMFGKMGAHKQGYQRTAFSDSGKASRFFFRFTEREEMKAYLETMIRC